MRTERSAMFYFATLLLDAALVSGVFMAVVFGRARFPEIWPWDVIPGEASTLKPFPPLLHMPLLVPILPLWLGSLHLAGCYRGLRTVRFPQQFARITTAVGVAFLALVLLIWSFQQHQFSRTLLVGSYVMEGCIKTGGGDYRIASKLPTLMAAQGLEDPHLWVNPKTYQCTPPYDEAAQLYRSFLLKTHSPEAAAAEWARWAMLFEAGGGPQELWEEFQQAEEILREQRVEQLREGRYSTAGSNMLGLCTSRVPR